MDETNEKTSRRPPWSRQDTAIAVLGVVLLVALTFPGYALANRVDPILLGMPFGMFWIVLWIVLGGLALLFIHRRVTEDGHGQHTAADDAEEGER